MRLDCWSETAQNFVVLADLNPSLLNYAEVFEPVNDVVMNFECELHAIDRPLFQHVHLFNVKSVFTVFLLEVQNNRAAWPIWTDKLNLQNLNKRR